MPFVAAFVLLALGAAIYPYRDSPPSRRWWGVLVSLGFHNHGKGGSRQALDAGTPDALVNVLYLAALADVRLLIFDPDAAALDGLAVFDE